MLSCLWVPQCPFFQLWKFFMSFWESVNAEVDHTFLAWMTLLPWTNSGNCFFLDCTSISLFSFHLFCCHWSINSEVRSTLFLEEQRQEKGGRCTWLHFTTSSHSHVFLLKILNILKLVVIMLTFVPFHPEKKYLNADIESSKMNSDKQHSV